jgi:hypothetical protein
VSTTRCLQGIDFTKLYFGRKNSDKLSSSYCGQNFHQKATFVYVWDYTYLYEVYIFIQVIWTIFLDCM